MWVHVDAQEGRAVMYGLNTRSGLRSRKAQLGRHGTLATQPTERYSAHSP
jgi:hypothetical protein